MVIIIWVPGSEVRPYATRGEDSLEVFKTFARPSDAFPGSVDRTRH